MSSATRWVRVTRVENIPVREGRAIKLGAREIAIFNIGGRFLAVAAHCPHKRGPLAEGIVTGASVVCPLHAWKINLETGAVAGPTANPASVSDAAPPCIETFRARVEDGVVLVEVPEGPGVQEPPRLVCLPQDRPASFLY